MLQAALDQERFNREEARKDREHEQKMQMSREQHQAGMQQNEFSMIAGQEAHKQKMEQAKCNGAERMTDNLDQDVSRGKQAQSLLENPILTECFDTLRAEYLKAWEGTSARDTDARERLWQAVQIVGKVRTHLNGVVSASWRSARLTTAGKKPKRWHERRQAGAARD
jgi:hypothetical protein